VIAVDTNILIYAHREDSPWHTAAYKCIEHLSEEAFQWTIPWPCVHEFYSIVTHPKIFSPPSTQNQALDQLQSWFNSPSLFTISEASNYWGILEVLLIKSKVVGPKIHDAKIAAICLQHEVEKLWSSDRDFSLFTNLKVENPLPLFSSQ
jgi:toxin-antitoxin system PIN domain toxin